MNQTRKMTCEGVDTLTDCKRLPASMRKAAAERKYASAVEMYASTDMSIRSIAEKCGVTPVGLSDHLGKHHRHLLLARYGYPTDDESVSSLSIRPPKGQTPKSYLKYRDAVEACGDMAYIEFNVSQIADMFGLNPTSLSSRLKTHYPEIIPYREKLRRRLGIADNHHRGPRPWCVRAYEEAVRLYDTTELTIAQVASRCNVSEGGLSEFLRFYHHDVIARRAALRKASMKPGAVRQAGAMSGNGAPYGPKATTVARYASALELYRTSPLTIDEIVAQTGVPDAGFRAYLRRVEPCCAGDGERRPLRSTAAKYAPAIASLSSNPRPVAQVASEFGLNADVFRAYLKKHQPHLAGGQGMARSGNGKLVKRVSAEKYARAIHDYATTPETLKSIARRYDIVYNSLVGYMKRNCSQAHESHRLIARQAPPLQV